MNIYVKFYYSLSSESIIQMFPCFCRCLIMFLFNFKIFSLYFLSVTKIDFYFIYLEDDFNRQVME